MSDSLEVRRTYNALGQLTRSQWQDGQQWHICYDKRALVNTVEWFDPQNQQWQAVADYERNIAGLPITRENAYGQTRQYTYDVLSRPLTDALTLNDQAETLMRAHATNTRILEIVVDVEGRTNGVSADAHYEYDVHDRLISATGPNDYQGQFTYSETGNILSANVSWEGATHTRNVKYSYGQLDPQAVDVLTDAVTDETYAAYAYDDAGNMTWRDSPDGESILHWDGKDRIRQVETANGFRDLLL
ncbi:hypothetical protein [Rhodohalobacter sp.]|uniref:hypothetical protein n=1 Tax=Rhodohalobacter sp. TaxID=1974210 RepID=UPI002ACD4041|nr:hypothetical protein [Rhodohalobacter sp.]